MQTAIVCTVYVTTGQAARGSAGGPPAWRGTRGTSVTRGSLPATQMEFSNTVTSMPTAPTVAATLCEWEETYSILHWIIITTHYYFIIVIIYKMGMLYQVMRLPYTKSIYSTSQKFGHTFIFFEKCFLYFYYFLHCRLILKTFKLRKNTYGMMY